MSKRLIVFNHKGGVSKTTTTYNIGWMLAAKKNILLVDGDPQCNLSSLILGDAFESYYIDQTTKLQNLKDGVSAAFQGKPTPIGAVTCVSPKRAKKLFLLAGHANLSEYDAALTFAQTSNNAIATLQNLPGAFAELLSQTEEKYKIDLTIIDLNPSLSAINQNLFLISDAFVIPTNPDPFSLMALTTLKSMLPRWVKWKVDSLSLFQTSAYPLPPGTPKFLGSLVQRFNVRNGKAARPFRDNIEEISLHVLNELVPSLASAGMTLRPEEYGKTLLEAKYCLGEIPDFQGLLPKSQQEGVPVFALKDAEIHETGPVLRGLQEKRKIFKEMFEMITSDLSRMITYA